MSALSVTVYRSEQPPRHQPERQTPDGDRHDTAQVYIHISIDEMKKSISNISYMNETKA